MLSSRKLRIWHAVHKWTSLVCTLFLLMLCITGLPLIFYHELEHVLGYEVEAPEMPESTPMASLDRVVGAGEAAWPEGFVQFVIWDQDEPGRVFLSMAEAPDAPPTDNRALVVDARTAQYLGDAPVNEGILYVIRTLHIDLFAGLPGKLFLGLMGLLFVVAIVSGVVLYGPFMRKLDFGAVRRHRARRIRWLDLHNLLGIATVVWVLVVGFTGVVNTWADLLLQLWRVDELAEMVAPYRDKPPLDGLVSLDSAMATAREAAPGMKPSFVAYPRTLFTSNHHYMVAMIGETPLTSRLIKPVLVDAGTAELTAARDMPWYLTALLVSQPLHFGDYGGLPLKIVWALLDIAAIVVLGSGVYLWLARRRVPIEARLAELERDAQRAETQEAA